MGLMKCLLREDGHSLGGELLRDDLQGVLLYELPLLPVIDLDADRLGVPTIPLLVPLWGLYEMLP